MGSVLLFCRRSNEGWPGKPKQEIEACGQQIKSMNILSLVVHGQKEVPELGVLSRNIETPEGLHHTAVLGMG